MTKKVIEAHNSILDLVGKTPLIKLHKTVHGFLGSYYAKAEFANPGQNTKNFVFRKYHVENPLQQSGS